MKITSVSYGTTENIGNYESIRLSADGSIEDDETPEEALDKLRQWVDQQSAMRKEVSSLEKRKSDLVYANASLKGYFETARGKWAKMESHWEKTKEFLKLHGVQQIEELPKLPRAWVEKDNNESDDDESDDDESDDDESDEEYI